MFGLGRLFQTNLCLRGRPEPILRGSIPLKLLALLTSIRLDWKGLPGTNSLAFYKHSQITDVKSFITLGPGVDGNKKKISPLTLPTNKLECLTAKGLLTKEEHIIDTDAGKLLS